MEWGKRFSELEECCSDSDLVKKWARDVSQRLPQTLSEYSSVWGKTTVKYPSNLPFVAESLCKLAEEKSGDRELQASLMCVALFFACDTEIRTGFPSDCVIWRLVFSAIEEKNGNAKLEAAALSALFLAIRANNDFARDLSRIPLTFSKGVTLRRRTPPLRFRRGRTHRATLKYRHFWEISPILCSGT